MKNRDRQAETWARDLVQKHGFTSAQQIATHHRDNNAQATISFSIWNRIVKQLRYFQTVQP